MKTDSTDIADFWLEADDNVVVVRVCVRVVVVDADRRINRLSLSTHLSSSAIQAPLLSCILLLSLSCIIIVSCMQAKNSTTAHEWITEERLQQAGARRV